MLLLLLLEQAKENEPQGLALCLATDGLRIVSPRHF